MPTAHRRLIALIAVVLAAGLTLALRRMPQDKKPRTPTPTGQGPGPAAPVPGAAPSPAVPDAGARIAIDVELWRLPAALPQLGPVAPPMPALDLEPRIAGLVRRGQVTQGDALHAARAVWPALARCGIDRQRSVVATFALSGGQIVGASAIHGARLEGPLSEAERSCALAALAAVQAPVATDCQGEIDVHFGVGAAQP
ncbi:MAG: hypothetical protein FJ100_07375 [Deltaproteobacteria bacterium]|nr:hypothetical protein [Deltaproteobacteria bacterium]